MRSTRRARSCAASVRIAGALALLVSSGAAGACHGESFSATPPIDASTDAADDDASLDAQPVLDGGGAADAKDGSAGVDAAPDAGPPPALGSNLVGSGTAAIAGGNVLALAFQARRTTSVSRLQVFVGGGSATGGLAAAFYDDYNAQPTTRRSRGNIVSPKPNAWNVVTLDQPVMLVSGGQYWIALAPGDGSTLEIATAPGSGAGRLVTATAPPSPWPPSSPKVDLGAVASVFAE